MDHDADFEEAYWQRQYEQWMEVVDEVMPSVYRAFESRGFSIDRIQAKEVVEIAHEADDPDWSYNYDKMIEDLWDLVSPSAEPLLQDWDGVYNSLESLFPLQVP